MFLHGLSTNGNGDDELPKLLNTGLTTRSTRISRPTRDPSCCSPPSTPACLPSADEIQAFIAFARTSYDINVDRVYLTGLSWARLGPDLRPYLDSQIVAMVPIAGDGEVGWKTAGCALGADPVWAFHGDADTTVDVSGTNDTITDLQACRPRRRQRW